MNHDDALSNSMFDLPDQVKKSTAIEQVADLDFAIEQATSSVGTLAATEDYQARQVSVEKAQSLATPVVDNFLPSPNRLLVLGSLGLVGALAVGAVASTLLTYRTTVKTQAVVQPVGEIQPVQSGEGGVVDTIFVQEYDTLESGQVIAAFKNSSLQEDFAQAEAQIAGTEERIGQVDGQLQALERRRLAESAWVQQLTVGGTGNGLPQFEYSKRRLLEYRSDLEAQLSIKRSKLEKIQQQIDDLTIRASQAGNIYDLQLSRLGQTVSSNETIAKIVSNKANLEITALVPETQIENVEVGQPVRMNLSRCASFRMGTFRGNITSIEPLQPDVTADLAKSENIAQNSYRITAESSEQRLQSGSRTCELLPGMEGELTIIAKQEKLIDFFLRKLRFKTNV